MTPTTSVFRLVTEKLAALMGAAANADDVLNLEPNAQMVFVSRFYACRIAPTANVVMTGAAALADCVRMAFSARSQREFVWALARLPARGNIVETMGAGIPVEHARQGPNARTMFV